MDMEEENCSKKRKIGNDEPQIEIKPSSGSSEEPRMKPTNSEEPLMNLSNNSEEPQMQPTNSEKPQKRPVLVTAKSHNWSPATVKSSERS